MRWETYQYHLSSLVAFLASTQTHPRFLLPPFRFLLSITYEGVHYILVIFVAHSHRSNQQGIDIFVRYNAGESCVLIDGLDPSSRVIQCNTPLDASSPSLDLAISSGDVDVIYLHSSIFESEHSFRLTGTSNGYYEL